MKILKLASSPGARFIVFSDAHRGDGTGADDFASNSLFFKCALDYYLEAGFTLIELGDAEELWENRKFDQIYITHTSIYERLAAFHDTDPQRTRYIKIWGNHDLYWEEHENVLHGLFPGIVVCEAAVIDDRILLWHGHQADPECKGFTNRFNKFFVRYVWAALQRLGFRDPTRAANNPGRCDDIDWRLHNWATGGMPREMGLGDMAIDTIIAGHTHRPVCENLTLTERRYLESHVGTSGIQHKLKPDPAYYNAGSCVHPRCITGIEISNLEGKCRINLVKWGYEAQPPAYSVAIKREVLQ